MINYKFIITATLTFIPYTALSFLWHNNLFHNIYYSINSIYSVGSQNIWAMNFANALLVYGFTYFYFKTVKPETKLYQSILWSVNYNLSVIGFFSFMVFGILRDWSPLILIHDMIFAVIGGVFAGVLTHMFFRKINI